MAVTPAIRREVYYITRCYQVQGDGVTVPHERAWVPGGAAAAFQDSAAITV